MAPKSLPHPHPFVTAGVSIYLAFLRLLRTNLTSTTISYERILPEQ